jgi:hypothetical protein
MRNTAAAGFAAMLMLSAVTAQQVVRPAGWDEATHGSRVRPDYERLFSMDRVHELRITIAPARFRAMQDDLTSIMPGRGLGMPGRGFGVPPAGLPDAAAMKWALAGVAVCKGQQPGAACTANGMSGQCTAMPVGDAGLVCLPADFAKFAQAGPPRLTVRDPVYVPVTVTHDGGTWTSVGMRYKGNSSLMASNFAGNGKVPFRLHFDRYEGETPAIRNQRFYGFQELTFSSNLGDDSQLREVLATEVLRDRGVAAARAAFYRIHVDTGSGPEYWGLYTMIEDPSDGAMLDAQFGSDTGNLYKPEGPGANFSVFDRAGFEKKTNEAEADFSDIEGAIRALHAPRDDARAWRAALEARFDVDHFLRWLGVNTVIENWDAYGVFAHNYYLYGDPARGGVLRWIPWDHNFAFGAAPRFGPGAGGGAAPPLPAFPGMQNSDPLHRNVSDAWPLVKRLMADEDYAARYRAHLRDALSGLADLAAFERRARTLHALITPAIAVESATRATVRSREAFERALDGPDGLVARLRARHGAIRAALAAK